MTHLTHFHEYIPTALSDSWAAVQLRASLWLGFSGPRSASVLISEIHLQLETGIPLNHGYYHHVIVTA